MDVINIVEKLLAGEDVSVNPFTFTKVVREKIIELKKAQANASTSCEKTTFVEFMKNPTPSENPEFQKIYETVTTLRDIQKAINGTYVGTDEVFIDIQKRCVAQDAQIKHGLETLQSYIDQAFGKMSEKTVVSTVPAVTTKSPLTITKCKITLGAMVNEKTSKVDEIAQVICSRAGVSDDWRTLYYEELACFDMPANKQYVYPAPYTVAFCRNEKVFYAWMPAIGSTAVEVFTFEPFIFTNMSGFVERLDGVTFVANAVGYASRVNTDLRPFIDPLQKYFCTSKPGGRISIELPPKSVRSVKGSGVEIAPPVRSHADHYQMLAAFAGNTDSWLLDTNERAVYGKAAAAEEMNRSANYCAAVSLVICCKRAGKLTRETHRVAIPAPTVTVTETPYLKAAKKAATNRFEPLAGHEDSQEAVASPFGPGKQQEVDWAEDAPAHVSEDESDHASEDDSGEESDKFE